VTNRAPGRRPHPHGRPIRSNMRKLLPTAIITALVSALLAFAPNAAATNPGNNPHPDQSPYPIGTAQTFCGHNEHTLVRASIGAPWYGLRNPYWRGSGQACMHTTGRNNFVMRSTPNPSRDVTSYPNLFLGCKWNFCTPDTQFPIQTSKIHSLTSYARTRAPVPGAWNASYDIWFSHQPNTSTQADGTELMIWTNRHGYCCGLARNATRVFLNNHWWIRSYWRMDNQRKGVSYNYVQYRLVNPQRGMHLDLLSFIHDTETIGQLSPSWYLDTVGFGFEIWAEGVGLGVTNFSVSLNQAAPITPAPQPPPKAHNPTPKPRKPAPKPVPKQRKPGSKPRKPAPKPVPKPRKPARKPAPKPRKPGSKPRKPAPKPVPKLRKPAPKPR
jgi:hypothetical protein